jgi:O-antigen ligase
MGETGIPGLFLWLGIIYMAFKNLFAAYRELEDPKSRSYVMAIGLSIAGYILSSLFVTLEYETFYFLLAIASAAGGSLRVEPTLARRDLSWLTGIMAAFFIAVKGFAMLYAY